MSCFVIDWEADGPIPPDYSGVCFGAVLVKPGLNETFYGKVKPISDKYIQESLDVSGFSREEHLKFPEPEKTMKDFTEWIERVNGKGRPIFFSDNPAFDWLFNHWYLIKYTGKDPFGWSGRRIGDLYCGLVKDSRAKWKHLRLTKHDHNPINDAISNAEALMKMKDMGLKIDFN